MSSRDEGNTKNSSQATKVLDSVSPPLPEKGIIPLVVGALLLGIILSWWNELPEEGNSTKQPGQGLVEPFRKALPPPSFQPKSVHFPTQGKSNDSITTLFNLVDLKIPAGWTIIPSIDPTLLILTKKSQLQPSPLVMVKVVPVETFQEGWGRLHQAEQGKIIERGPIQNFNDQYEISWTDLEVAVDPSLSQSLKDNPKPILSQRRQYILQRLEQKNRKFLTVFISIATETTESITPLPIEELLEFAQSLTIHNP